MNERITENLFRRYIENDESYLGGIVKVEEQKSENIKINKLLANASKSGNGKGYPEFIITFDYYPELIMVVECKADISKHESATGDKYKDYAVDGVKLYSSFLAKEYDVIAVALSGDEDNYRLSSFIQLKGTTECYQTDQLKDDRFYTIDEYIDVFKKDDKKFNQDYGKLLEFSKTLNDELHILKIHESDRSLLISATLIALNDPAFYNSYKLQNPKDLSNNLYNTVKSKLEELQKDNIDEIMVTYGFLKTHKILSKKEHKLRDIIEEIDVNVNSFMRTHKYFDSLGQFYIEFLRYANSDKGLGIVLTPPHITELFSILAKVNENSIVLDNCTGTGGFLVSAMNKMVRDAGGDKNKELEIKKGQIIGIEFSDKIFPLACSNMYIHGDGRSHLYSGSCFDENIIKKVLELKPNVGFLNPPYKNDKNDTDELMYILNNLSMLEKGSYCIAIVPMSCALADSGERLELKKKLLKNNTLDAVFSMNNELFHNSKVTVSTCIMVFKAKEPHPKGYKSYFGYWKNDGFYKRKAKGRADYDNTWNDIKTKWANAYFNREEIAGFSVKKEITAEDEWCAEAYMETSYKDLNINDFQKAIKDYAIFKIKNGISDEVKSKSVLNESYDLNISKWEEFVIDDGTNDSLFKVDGSKSIVKYEVTEYGIGKYPYVVTSSENNGVEGLYDYYTEEGNVLTIDSATVGSCFYQELPFSASDHVEKLISRYDKFNKYIGLFISTVINLEQARYGYGRKFAQKRIKPTIIKLPVKNGKPDYDFMEKFIKSLPYSSSI